MAQNGSFVTVKNHQLSVNDKPLYYVGTNYWYGGLIGLEKNPKRGIERLKAELDFLQQKGVRNLRILAGAEGEGLAMGTNRVQPPLQKTKAVFDTSYLNGLDILLSEMAKRNMKAVIFLSNNWEWSGGFLQYLRWNDMISDSVFRHSMSWDDTRDYISKFYSCKDCIADYFKQVNLLLEHTNKITNIKLADDPAIMAWEIANEPRPMRPAAIEDYKRWIAAVASFIKQKDKHHLVTIGTEGYIGTENKRIYQIIHADKNIDYLTIHIWPKNWDWFHGKDIAGGMNSVIAKTRQYITDHVEIATQLNKPLVIEEFGLPRDGQVFTPGSPTRYRDQYYREIFSILQKNKTENGTIAGVNFWSYAGNIKPAHERWQEGDEYIGDPPMEEQGLNAVFNADISTWQLIEKVTKTLQ